MQTEVEAISHYSRHLRNDEVLGTKEYQIKKLMDILGLIAKIKDRMKNIADVSKKIFGVNENGKIKATAQDAAKYANYSEMLKRVKTYYNNNISKLKTF